MKHQVTAYPLRIPKDVRMWIEGQASKDSRSINSFLLILIKKAMEAQK